MKLLGFIALFGSLFHVLIGVGVFCAIYLYDNVDDSALLVDNLYWRTITSVFIFFYLLIQKFWKVNVLSSDLLDEVESVNSVKNIPNLISLLLGLNVLVLIIYFLNKSYLLTIVFMRGHSLRLMWIPVLASGFFVLPLISLILY